MRNVSLYIRKKAARRHGIKINNFRNLKRTAHLILECPSSLGDTVVWGSKTANLPCTIGAHTYIRSGDIFHLESIGRYCSIGQNVTIGQDPRNHPVHWVSTSPPLCSGYISECTPSSIGHDVWIGPDAVIMAGIKVGNGAVIARNALVTKDVEPYQIVGGNPAKPIRFRFDSELISDLLQSNWWNFDTEKLAMLPHDDVRLFLNGLETISLEAKYPTITIRNRRIVSTSP